MNIELLQSLVGEVLKIDRGGPESRIGKLLTVGEDYFTFLSKEDGVILYKTYHIKSVTQNSKKSVEFDVVIPEDLNILKGADFKSALTELKYKWVKINRGGKESVEGVLDDSTDDYLTLIVNEDVIRISMFHIRSVSYGAVVEEIKKDEAKNESKDKDEKKEDQ